MGWGGFWLEDDGTEKEFGGWEGREVADKCWGRGEEWGQDPSTAWLALEGGWLCAAGSWPPDKGEERAGKGDTAAQLSPGLAQQPVTRLGGHCHTRWDGESMEAHSSAPLKYPTSHSVPMHAEFCLRESLQPPTSG